MGSLFDVQRAELQDGSRCQKLWTSWQTSWSCWGRRSMKRLICSLWKKQRLFSKNADFWLFDLLHLGSPLSWDSGWCGTPQGCPVIILTHPSKHQFLNAGIMVLWWMVECCSAITGYTCWQVPEIISQSLRTDIKRRNLQIMCCFKHVIKSPNNQFNIQ